MVTQKELKTTRLKKKQSTYETTIRIDSPNKAEKKIKYPTGFITKKQIIKRVRKLQHGATQGQVTEHLFDGICIEERIVHLKSPLDVHVKHNFPYLKMHFEITGYSSYSANNNSSIPIEIEGGHHQLFFFPKVDGKLSYAGNNIRKTLEITLSLQFIKRAFKNNWEILESFGTALFESQPFVFGKKSKPITPDIYNVIQQIVQCELPDHLKRAYLKSKVTELLVLQIYHLNKIHPNENKQLPENYYRIIKAKEYLLQYIDQPITIHDIALEIGINSNSVKKGFNEVYNMPFFQYLTSLRLKKAVYLLEETNQSIAEIANSVGYRYSQHFSKTFKKYYGKTPNQFRQKN